LALGSQKRIFWTSLKLSPLFASNSAGATISLLFMKPLAQKIKSLLWVVLVGLLAAMPFQSKAQQAEVSFQIFYDELAPYGQWILHPKHGDVWKPNVEGEFTPYLTNGYWTVSQYGNTWVSNYDWGWAPFHYGRWFFDDFEGWVWIPDTTWAPAWVVWRNGGGYYGWAPMSPGLNFSVSLNIYNGIPSFYWCFVPQQYVWRPYVYRYCAPRQRNVYIVNNTTYVTHYHGNTYNYFSGPSHTEIQYITRRPVVINQIEHCDRPGRAQFDRDKIVMYRPVITRNDNDRPKLTSVPRNNNGLHKGWDKGSGPSNGGNGNGTGNNGNNGNGQGNNGHGNGDQDALGNSGGNNNGENSDNSGNGNSGNGNGNSGKGNGNGNNGGRNSGFSDTNGSSSYKKSTYRSEPERSENRTTPVRSYSPGNSNKSTSSGSTVNSGRGQSSDNRQMSSGSSGGSTRSYTPSRTTSSNNRSQSGYSPSKSTPTGSQSVSPSGGGSRGNSSVTPNRSGGGQRSAPSNSGGSNSGGSKSSGGSKKRN
jgi:uncharacterized membrane protein YgcG